MKKTAARLQSRRTAFKGRSRLPEISSPGNDSNSLGCWTLLMRSKFVRSRSESICCSLINAAPCFVALPEELADSPLRQVIFRGACRDLQLGLSSRNRPSDKGHRGQQPEPGHLFETDLGISLEIRSRIQNQLLIFESAIFVVRCGSVAPT